MGAVRDLGEIALRVDDLDAMQRFYGEVIGLELMKRFEQAAFFKLADGHAGHTRVLALFDRKTELDGAKTTLDHIAFNIDRADYESEKARLEALGLDVRTAYHDWVRWRSLYVHDPEGNTVELVCYEAS